MCPPIQLLLNPIQTGCEYSSNGDVKFDKKRRLLYNTNTVQNDLSMSVTSVFLLFLFSWKCQANTLWKSFY